MIRIAVCDDNKTMCDLIYKCACEAFAYKEIECEIIQYEKGSLLLKENKNENFDVLFLDIQMPIVDGFDIAEEIKKEYPKIHIIFITANSELVFKTFTYQPFYFIRKTTADGIMQDILVVANLLIERFKQFKPIVLVLPFAEQRTVSIRDILYIESTSHYLTYHMLDGEKIKVRNAMENIILAMIPYDFVRIHRKFLINLHNVRKLDNLNNVIVMTDNASLDIGRTYKQEVYDKYVKYMRITDIK